MGRIGGPLLLCTKYDSIMEIFLDIYDGILKSVSFQHMMTLRPEVGQGDRFSIASDAVASSGWGRLN